MNCNSCNETMTAVYGHHHFHCQACNQFQFPTEIEEAEDGLKPSGKVTDFQCPKCELPLEVGLLRNMVDVCFCPNCRGFVIDCATFGALINDLRGSYAGPDDLPFPLDPEELDIQTTCPACAEQMESHPYYGPGNSVLDTCRFCQLVWFDHGELARLVRAPGLRPNVPRLGDYESAKLRQTFQDQAENSGTTGLAMLLSRF